MKSLLRSRDIFSGAILAGGRNKRFPINKSFLKIEGINLIERNIKVLSSICNEVLINTNNPEQYFKFKVGMCADIFPFRGPMSGIHSSLVNAKSDNLLIVACDMPFLKIEVLLFLIESHLKNLERGFHNATIPIYNNKFQPLCGIYHRALIPFFEDHLVNYKNSLSLFLKDVGANFVEERYIREIDPEGLTFLNINTIYDLNFLCTKFPDLSLTL